MKQVLLSLLLLLFLPTQAYAEGKLVINEFLAHVDSDHKEWVEFYNPEQIDLSSYWIDDDPDFTNDKGSATKKSLAVMNTNNPQYPYIEVSSFLNNDEDYVVLFDTSGTIIDQYQYLKDPGTDIAVGRSPDGQGEFQILSAATQGGSNAQPMPTVTQTAIPTPTTQNTPIPTKEPTPTKTPTPTKISSPTISSPTKIPTLILQYNPTVTHMAIRLTSALPASDSGILGESTQSAALTPKPSRKPNRKKVLVKAIKTKAYAPQGFMFIGIAVLLISCAILIFIKVKNSNR